MKQLWPWTIEILMVLIPLALIVLTTNFALRRKPSTVKAASHQESDITGIKKVGQAIAFGLCLVLSMTISLMVLNHPQWLSWVVAIVPHAARQYILLVLVMPFVLVGFQITARLSRWRRRLVNLSVVALIVVTIVSQSWITNDICTLTLVFMYGVTTQPRVSFTRLSIILLIGAVLYDAVQVYATGAMQQRVERVASKPTGLAGMAFIIPENLGHMVVDLQHDAAALIGTGDILLGCIMAVSAGRVAQRTNVPRIKWAAYCGFVLAMTLGLAAALIFKIDQPATIYLVPCIWLLVQFAAWRAGVTEELKLPLRHHEPITPKATTQPAIEQA